MSPTEIFSSNGEEISKTAQVFVQNAHNSFPNAQIDTFRPIVAANHGLEAIPPKKRFYLQNLDGRTTAGTEKELLTVTGLSRQLFYQLKTGRTEYAKRWRVLYYENAGLREHVQLRGSKRKYIIFFRNSGHVIKRTRIEFARLTGLDRNFVYEQIRKGKKINGWNYKAKTI